MQIGEFEVNVSDTEAILGIYFLATELLSQDLLERDRSNISRPT